MLLRDPAVAESQHQPFRYPVRLSPKGNGSSALCRHKETNTSKQPKTTVPTDADLKGNPGIGTSKGTALLITSPSQLLPHPFLQDWLALD